MFGSWACNCTLQTKQHTADARDVCRQLRLIEIDTTGMNRSLQALLQLQQSMAQRESSKQEVATCNCVPCAQKRGPLLDRVAYDRDD